MSETERSEMIKTFFEHATVNQLKSKLKRINVSTAGVKASLVLRLQKEWAKMPTETLKEHILNDEGHLDLDTTNYDEAHGEEVADGPLSRSLNPDDNLEDLNEEITRLRDIISKKNEILELKRQLSLLSEETDNGKGYYFNFKDIENSLPSFSGDDNFSIKKWLENFEENACIMGWDEKTKLLYAKRLMTGTAKLFLRTTSIFSWTDLKNKLIQEFHKKVTKAEIYEKLRCRMKKKDETFHQYALSMQEIASLADIDESDIVRYTIAGIPDLENNKVLLYQANTMIELKELLKKYELLKINQSSQQSSFRSNNFKSFSPVNTRNRDVKCFNCNSYGHISSYCKKPRYDRNGCFKCGKKDHKVNECPDRVMNVYKSISLEEFEHKLNLTFYKDDEYMMSAPLVALIDSGSPISFIQEKYVPSFLIMKTNCYRNKYFGVNDSPLNIIGEVHCTIQFLENNLNLNLLVVKDFTMKHCVILGRDFIRQNKMRLVTEHEADQANEVKNNLVEIDKQGMCENSDILMSDILNIEVDNCKEITLDINENLAYNIKRKVYDVVKQMSSGNRETQKNTNSDSDSNSSSNSNFNNFQMEITLTKDDVFYSTPRRLPYTHVIELRKIIDDLLDRKIIRESNSPYASPIVLVKKKTGDLRLCVDFRELNKITARDNYPLPVIEDILDRLRGKKYFTTLDLRSGFHQVNMSPNSIKYTSFVTPIGQYEYLKMPFGLKNAPSVFQRFINSIFKDLVKSGSILIFLDDFMIATESIEEHLKILEKVIDTLLKHSLELRYDKCRFLYEEIDYLGYTINKTGIKPNFSNLKAVKDFPIPKTTKEVQGFIGLCSYFRKFIKDFALHCKPLYDLLRKDAVFRFGETELKSFEFLKSKLLEAPLLRIYNPNSLTELHCDASSYGFGAVLLQKQMDGKFHPVFYFSKRATEVESRYHSYELETLSIIYALRRFRIYLLGIDFKIVTDCQALTLTLNKKLLNPRIARWGLELQDYSYRIEHRASSKMMHVDALSRYSNILTISDESFDAALASAQNKDPIIRKILKDLEVQESPFYALYNGHVYRKINDEILFYVPEQMENRVMQIHHDNLCHLGADKCYDYIRKVYWFPNMKSKIVSYIGNCLKCIHFSPSSGKVEGTLHNIPKGDLPFDVIHIDHYGPLPNSGCRKKYIFEVIDGFTKFTKLFAVNSTKSREVISCLKEYFAYYSRPNKIISDRGSCFTSKEFSHFVSLYNIQHIKIATLSPQANGQIERVNRVLTPMLAKEMPSDSTSSWYKNLDKVEFALNNTIHRSTGFSPSMLLFGIEQKGQVCDKIREYLIEKQSKARNLEECRTHASKRIEQNQSYNKKLYDQNRRPPHKYEVGDYVMLRNVVTEPGVHKKFLPRFKGPYQVVKVLDNDRYCVKDIEGLQLSRIPYEGICSPMNMKLYKLA